jgi:cell wall-associated NlpC family hydrolase
MIPADDFVGIPWLRHGRSRAGADCWGLCCLWYAERLGVQLPDYAGVMARIDADALGRHLLIEEASRRWERFRADEGHPHDIVLLRAGRVHEHVGVYLGAGYMLHSEGPEPSLSVIQRVSDPSLRHRVICHFRMPQGGFKT